MTLIADTEALLHDNREVAAILGVEPQRFADFPDLAGALLAAFGGVSAEIVQRIYAATPGLVDLSLRDIAETARRNFEPGGAVATLLFARGVHAVMGHRIAHHLWQEGDHTRALAIKSRFGRAFSTDIHPAARIGAGFWLDHGLGFVAGETSVIGQDVSIWHNVTLGSTLSDSGPQRHPIIEDGAVIGPCTHEVGSKRQDFQESGVARLMRSIVATPTLKCRAMARMDWPSSSMVLT